MFTYSQIENEFRTAMTDAGIITDDPIVSDGVLHRIHVEGDKSGSRNGAYILHCDGNPSGYFENFKSGVKSTWSLSGKREPLTPAMRQQIDLEQAKRQKEQAERHSKAAEVAQQILNDAKGDSIQHHYALKKAVDFGPMVKRGTWPQRDWKDALLVPVFAADGTLATVQAINIDGAKDFLRGGKKAGGFYPLGEIRSADRIFIGEGLATVAAIRAVTGATSVVAFDCGNLNAVCHAVKELSPAAEIVICADNDIRSDGQNPGLEASARAAEAVGGRVAVPEIDGRKVDFWDVLNELGADAVRDALRKAIDPENDSSGFANAGGNHWPKPQPLTAKIEAEDYPLDAFPDTILEAVEEVAAFIKAPLPLVAGSALGALSLALQAHCDIKRAERLTGPTGLFMLSIADSGERKTTCDGFFTSAIRQYEAEQAELSAPLLKDYAAELAAWSAEREGLLSAIKDAGKKGANTTKFKDDLKELEHCKPEPPRIPRLILGDETPENLAYTLAKNWPSAGVVSSEAGAVFGAHGMGKESVMRNLALLNVLWDGGELSIGRRSSESFTVKDARLTVALQIQEATLREFFARSGALARGTGFLARFLIAWPESTQGNRLFTDPPETWPKLARFHQRITEILNVKAPLSEQGGGLDPAMLSFTPTAKAAWIAFHDAIETELKAGGELYDVRDVASKTADNAARLAALFHGFANGIGGAVGDDSFEGASRIAAWHLSEARRFFGELALPAELANAARLDAWLVDYCRLERTHLISKRHVLQHGPLRNDAALVEALKELDELDRARLIQDGKRKTIQINPALLVGGAR